MSACSTAHDSPVRARKRYSKRPHKFVTLGPNFQKHRQLFKTCKQIEMNESKEQRPLFQAANFNLRKHTSASVMYIAQERRLLI